MLYEVITYIENGKDIVLTGAKQSLKNSETLHPSNFESLDDTSKEIVNILDEYVKPAVAIV